MTARSLTHETPAVVNDIRSYVGNFRPNPYLRLGDAESAHEVLLGDMEPYGAVAIKPFTRVGKAIREAKLIEGISDRGFETLEPLDIAVGGLGAYLVTKYLSGLRHLGQVDWAADIASRRLQTELVPTLQGAGQHIGQLHGARVVHGDFQAKNAAINRAGNPVVVDVERAQINQASPLFERGVDNDHTLFGLSVLARGLLADRSPTFRAGFLTDQFLMPSLEAEQNAGQEVELDRRVLDVQSRWVELIKVGRIPDWLQHQMAAEALPMGGVQIEPVSPS